MDWKTFLKQHPVFSPLAESEIDRILDANISTKREYGKNQTVFRMGESGNSLFLIGSGSVEVSLPEADNKMIPLRILRKGEFFGEIAVFDQSPRSATVITTEPCFLLEIKGPHLLNLVNDHPEIELKFLMHLSTRMRDLSDQVLAVKVKDVDEKIKAVNSRLDIELKVFDVSLKAAQTVFDHTSTRASEVIESVERSRSRMATVASMIGGVLSMIVAVFGFMGFNELKDFSDIKKEIVSSQKKLIKDNDEIQKIMRKLAPEIETINRDLIHAKANIQNFQKDFGLKVLLPRFRKNFNDDPTSALKTYANIFNIEDDEVDDEMFRLIADKIIIGELKESAGFLEKGLKQNLTSNHRQKILSYYLLLTALVLNDDRITTKGGIGDLEGLEDAEEFKVEDEDEPLHLTFKKTKHDLLRYMKNHPILIKSTIEEQFVEAAEEGHIGEKSKIKIKKIWRLITETKYQKAVEIKK